LLPKIHIEIMSWTREAGQHAFPNDEEDEVCEMLSAEFSALPTLIAVHAREFPSRRALVDDDILLSYSDLAALMSRIAAGLQRDGVAPQSPVAIVGETTAMSVAIFLSALQAGCVPAPMAPSATHEQLERMISDCGASIVFADREVAMSLTMPGLVVIAADEILRWCPPSHVDFQPIAIMPDDRFDIIYSSGTTGNPKGIVHTHAMRWMQTVALGVAGFNDAVTMVATPLYSNSTLVMLIPTLANGGAAVLIGKFDARRFLVKSERERATHAMLVPVQYQRVMDMADFDRFDLTSFRFKSCTGSPFATELKADIVKRWPGALVEIYGTTEGGGNCVLWADKYPDKLHTVGQPAPDNDIRLIDPEGNEVPTGEVGEVVGRSNMMMAGYHGQPEASNAATWTDPNGNQYIRQGDLGYFDEDGFLTLLGRSKDMIVSGGFNVYPIDIETVLLGHPQIADAAVIGVFSPTWGETPYAYLVTRENGVDVNEVVAWMNGLVGKTQRLSGAELIDELPRNTAGKVLKRELRNRFEAGRQRHTAQIEGEQP
jgi:acyl-CoA synthetase (AMP-forming)/AMP-acid ligase II